MSYGRRYFGSMMRGLGDVSTPEQKAAALELARQNPLGGKRENTMTGQSLVKANGSAVQPWASRDDVRELQERLKLMLPGGGSLKNDQLLALAQGAVAHGLDPLNGEIWMIPGRGLMIGVKGLRKKAREQVRGNFWIEFVELTNPEERKRLRIPDGALAYEARLYDSENIRTYAEAVSEFTKRGVPFAAVQQIIGAKPYTVGIGVLKAGEQTKMEPAQCAMKRAEADALKRRFDVPFGMAVATDEADSGPFEIIDGSAEDSTDQDDDKPPVTPDYTDPAYVAAQMEAEQARKADKSADQKALWG